MAYGFTFFNYRNLFIPPNNSLKTQCENVETYFQAYNRLVDFSTSKSIDKVHDNVQVCNLKSTFYITYVTTYSNSQEKTVMTDIFIIEPVL